MAGEKIVIIEDEGLVALALKQCLTGMGYVITATAATGEEAISTLSSERPDLVLMDIRLKGETDGIDLAYWIRQTYRVPVVFLTAHSDEKTLERAKIAEPFGYILKPFEENSLHSTIEMAIYKASIDSQLQRTKNKLSAILSSIREAVILCDLKGRIDFANKAAKKILGSSRKDMKNANIVELLIPAKPATGERIALPIEEVVSSGESVTLELVLIQSSQLDEIPANITVTPIFDEYNDTTGIVFTICETSTSDILATTLQI